MKNMGNAKKTIFSISSKPGVFGSMLYSRLFHEFDINFSYQTLSVSSEHHLCKIFDPFRLTDEFHGMSISMPYKINAALAFPNRLDCHPSEVDSVNTILKTEKGIRSCSTDLAFFERFSEIFRMPAPTVFIYGSGAMGSMAYAYFFKCGFDVVSIKRNQLIDYFPVISSSNHCYFVNCTPFHVEELGLRPSENCIFLDLPVRYDHPYADTPYIMTGYSCAMIQFQKQFKVYTGTDVDLDFVENICNKLFL